MTHESPTTPARRAKLQSIIIGPRLHLRICEELLELAAIERTQIARDQIERARNAARR